MVKGGRFAAVWKQGGCLDGEQDEPGHQWPRIKVQLLGDAKSRRLPYSFTSAAPLPDSPF